MKKKFLVLSFLFIAVSISVIFFLAENKNNQPNDQIILFSSNNCPHCIKVEKYLSENNIRDKIPFKKKEVADNQENTKKLIEKAKNCGLSTDLIDVPLLWDGKKCYLGDQEIIDFFQNKLKK